MSKRYLIIRNDDIDFNTDLNLLKSIAPIFEPYAQVFGVIPFLEATGKCTLENKELIRYLESRSLEYAIHGVFHRKYLGRYEFSTYTEQQEALYHPYLKQCCEYLPEKKTFIPPNNTLDPNWIPILKKFGFHVISSTKRENKSKIMQDIPYAEIGVIEKNGVYMIPQSFMIKKREYLQNHLYFKKLIERIENFYQKHHLLVITIHWWEFFGENLEDIVFRDTFVKFLEWFKRNGIESISFQEAVHISANSFIETNFFEL